MATTRSQRTVAPVNYTDTRITNSPGSAYGTNKFGGSKAPLPSHLRNEVSHNASTAPSQNTPYGLFPPFHPPGPLPLFVAPPGQRKLYLQMQKPTHQGTYTSYPSRLRTGVSSLIQPLVVTGGPQDGFGATQAGLAAATSGYASGSSTPMGSGPEIFSRSGRPVRQRINYAELEGSGEDDDGDSEDGQPALSEAQRQAAIAQARKEKKEKEQQMGWSWLGERPPGDRVHGGKAKRPVPDYQRYPILRPKGEDVLEKEAMRTCHLVPIRIDVETEHHRIRDCFTWNLNERLITPEEFAARFCRDVDIAPEVYSSQIAESIRTQTSEHQGLLLIDADDEEEEIDEEEEEDDDEDERQRRAKKVKVDVKQKEESKVESDCRVFLNLDLQIYTYNLRDRIEWDIGSNDLTPEQFTKHYCAELGLTGEAHAIIAHALHEELLRAKREAIEMGWLGPGAGVDFGDGTGRLRQDRPRKLQGIWRNWKERDHCGPSLLMMSMDDIEKKEVERIRVARRMRRDTARFGGGRVATRYRADRG